MSDVLPKLSMKWSINTIGGSIRDHTKVTDGTVLHVLFQKCSHHLYPPLNIYQISLFLSGTVTSIWTTAEPCLTCPRWSALTGPIYMTHPTKAICPILLVSRPAQFTLLVGNGRCLELSGDQWHAPMHPPPHPIWLCHCWRHRIKWIKEIYMILKTN